MSYAAFTKLKTYLNQQIVGQQTLVNHLLIALLADGHLLVEGAPGLAKTRAINKLAECISADFKRTQFTPDLLPSDLTGSDIYLPQQGEFKFQPGPLFHNIILADEINRAPAKVQSALLEAMAERQITIGLNTYPMKSLFMVMATQNPIEQEGTYPLPEAQLDRFLLHITIDYPDAAVEQQILKLNREQQTQPTLSRPQLSEADIMAARSAVAAIHMSEEVEQYLVQLVIATRQPAKYQEKLADLIQYGASPRATIGLDKAARAHAWLNGKDYVTPADIHAVVNEVLRHRIILSYTADAEGVTTDDIVNTLLEVVPIP